MTDIILLHVVPKSAKNQVIGWVDGANGQKALKVKVAAPPEDGKANKELLKFLAAEWGVARSTLELAADETSRHKRLKINDAALVTRLQAQT